MVDVAQLRALLDITDLENALQPARPVRHIPVAAMTLEALTRTATVDGFDPRWRRCSPCGRWEVCWHRQADARLRAVRTAQEATRPGALPIVSPEVARSAGALLPAGVHVGDPGRGSAIKVESLCGGDYLALRIPLPGLVYDDDGYGEVVAKTIHDGLVSITLARTNSPGTEATTYHYPARALVRAHRAQKAAA